MLRWLLALQNPWVVIGLILLFAAVIGCAVMVLRLDRGDKS
jgi:thiol:disulfide interchange protein